MRAYEFVNWFLDGWAGAYLKRQGYYSGVLETAKAHMEPYEWDYWMEGKPAAQDIKAPDGHVARQGRRGARRRLVRRSAWAAIACWNAVMDENDLHGAASGTSSSPPDRPTLFPVT